MFLLTNWYKIREERNSREEEMVAGTGKELN